MTTRKPDFPNWSKLVSDVKKSQAEKQIHTGQNKQNFRKKKRVYYGKRV